MPLFETSCRVRLSGPNASDALHFLDHVVSGEGAWTLVHRQAKRQSLVAQSAFQTHRRQRS